MVRIEIEEDLQAAPFREGRVQFQVGNAFYRPESQMARDLGLLAAAIYKSDRGELRVLDAMTGCGVRSLRYVLEAAADWVWANDANPEVHEVLQANLSQLPAEQVQITHWEARRVFADCYQRQDFFDLVDIDSFGNPGPYLSACLAATRIGGFIYLTSTDGKSLSGHFPEQSLRLLGGYGRSHPANQEQGLRLLLGSLMQQAGMLGMQIRPVFSFFSGQVFRVMVCLTMHQPWEVEDLAFLGYCHPCGHYQTVSWRNLNRSACPHHGLAHQPLSLSGPMWLGELHDADLLARMAEQATVWGWDHCQDLLQVMQAEAALPPYFFLLGEIGRRAKMDLPNRDRLLQALRDQGYRASPTHITPQAIKTDAPFAQCLEIARSLPKA